MQRRRDYFTPGIYDAIDIAPLRLDKAQCAKISVFSDFLAEKISVFSDFLVKKISVFSDFFVEKILVKLNYDVYLYSINGYKSVNL